MKRLAYILLASLSLTFISCTKQALGQDPVQSDQTTEKEASEGIVTLSLHAGAGISKSDSYLDNKSWETMVKTFQVFVFRASSWDDDSGEILFYQKYNSPTAVDEVYTISLSVTEGPVLVLVAANSTTSSSKAHSEVKTIAEAKLMYNSGTYWIDMTGSRGFAMTGSATGTVSAGETCELSISLAKPVGRVVLGTVTNSTSATLKPKAAFLTNYTWVNYYLYDLSMKTAPGYQDCEGRRNANRTVRVNPCDSSAGSYKYESGRTITQTSISASSSTTYNECFYSMENTITTYSSGYHTNYSTYATGQCVKLVILAEYTSGGKTVDYYYCVPLTTGISKGVSYTVNVTITGPGSDDPNIISEKSAIASSVTLSSWSYGNSVTGSLEK